MEKFAKMRKKLKNSMKKEKANKSFKYKIN